MISNLLKTSIAATVLLSSPAWADWSANLISLGATGAGATGQVECAPNGSFGSVWGTGTYTSDSSVCTAAVHYGWIAHDQGGMVDFRQVPGLDSYAGSAQNGVTSSDYGAWSASFQITGATPIGGGVRQIAWGDSADSLGVASAVGEVISLACPADSLGGGSVWGTDVYTSDSAICAAAAHRGHIVPATGGIVTVRILGSQPNYGGSERNGVVSSDYGEWSRSYSFH
ncbi:LCCL domain-containing protein [Gymnodinialimonas sp. 57CJ19]|uniref:LCCL domain-containing protein n=1 Tax=Gymnodinialimonas sp. 57CJ19 TaxID=3138498 RepID=UPI00313431FC